MLIFLMPAFTGTGPGPGGKKTDGAGIMQELNAAVAQKVEVSPYTIILRVVPLGWELPEFTPGQFAVLGLPGSARRCFFSDREEEPPDQERLIRRAYSIASSSVEREYVEFYITLVRSGALTPRLFSLEIGDRLWMGPKFSGIFTLAETPEDANVVMVATGTGLAPYMSMIRTALSCGDRRNYAVLHGSRHSWDLGYRSELVTMAGICPNFTYLPIISRPGDEPGGWGGRVGYVQDLWGEGDLGKALGFELTPEKTHVFLCGNPGMIDDMTKILAKKGFTEQTKKRKGEIHVERYW